MARARMIARNITKSKKIAQLSDRDRVIYAFILPFLDREGRINAHPTYLKGTVFLHLEYTEAQISEAVKRIHEVGLAIVYATEDDVVMQFKDFLVYNKPNHKESESEYPAPVEEITEPAPSPDVARAMPRQCPGNAGGEVEVEVEVKREVEVEGAPSDVIVQQSVLPASSAALKKARNQNFLILKSKLGQGRNDGLDMLGECLAEDPERDKWLELSTDRVREIIRQASPEKSHGRFKTTLIDLLDREIRPLRPLRKPPAPPVALAPPGDPAKEREERYQREYGADWKAWLEKDLAWEAADRAKRAGVDSGGN